MENKIKLDKWVNMTKIQKYKNKTQKTKLNKEIKIKLISWEIIKIKIQKAKHINMSRN